MPSFWDALGHALSSYLGGLALVLAIQGGLSAAALFLIGVPYALALGAWVSITAVIPYLGAWIGAIPALLVAFSISPTAAVLTGVFFLAIQNWAAGSSPARPSWQGLARRRVKCPLSTSFGPSVLAS